MKKAQYKTWIRTNNVIVFWSMTILLFAGSLLGFFQTYFFLLALAGLPFFYIAVIISLAAYRLSPGGDDLQNTIHQVIIDKSKVHGKVLDIGCGSGHLIITMAKQNPHGQYTGVDYWGTNWEYSKQQCEHNAQIEQVSGIEFIKASAAKLPFEAETFAHVVSCLTFHEVRDVKDKTDALLEALRVLKKQGSFVFLDLFADPKIYSSLEDIVQIMHKHGATDITLTKLSDILELPFPLNMKKVLQYAIIIEGKKSA